LCVARHTNAQPSETFLGFRGSKAAERFFSEQRDRNSRRDLGVHATYSQTNAWECTMRYGLLWLLGVPLPILLLIFLFGGLH
jgi:hypothetical protein